MGRKVRARSHLVSVGVFIAVATSPAQAAGRLVDLIGTSSQAYTMATCGAVCVAIAALLGVFFATKIKGRRRPVEGTAVLLTVLLALIGAGELIANYAPFDPQKTSLELHCVKDGTSGTNEGDIFDFKYDAARHCGGKSQNTFYEFRNDMLMRLIIIPSKLQQHEARLVQENAQYEAHFLALTFDPYQSVPTAYFSGTLTMIDKEEADDLDAIVSQYTRRCPVSSADIAASDAAFDAERRAFENRQHAPGVTTRWTCAPAKS